MVISDDCLDLIAKGYNVKGFGSYFL